ncbi:MAG: zinc ribbon domain-containing protein [Nitrosopumilus sp.]|nr:zinc ribbon domain-containing protein [Nitrosopumilus sp.]
MKIFNGRLATEDYMSSHSLTFSTPEMTLKKFALWLGELVNDPKTNISTPRLILYVEDRADPHKSSPGSNDKPDFLPDVDETFKPTGAISDLYGEKTIDKSSSTSLLEKKYCINCGANIKHSSKFCKKCGSIQE